MPTFDDREPKTVRRVHRDTRSVYHEVRWVHRETRSVYYGEPSWATHHLFSKEVKHKGRWVDPAEKLLWILKQPAWAGGVFTTQDGKLLYRKGSAVLTINDELEQRIRDMTTDTDSKGKET